MKLRKIRDKFGKSDYDYKLIKRDGDWAIYEMKMNGTDEIASYELHKVRTSPLTDKNPTHRRWKNQGYTSAELLASASEFGTRAWSFPNLDLAKKDLIERKKGNTKGYQMPNGEYDDIAKRYI